MSDQQTVAFYIRRLSLAFERLSLDEEKLALWMEKLVVFTEGELADGVDRVIEGRAGQVYGAPSLPQLMGACRESQPEKHTISPEVEADRTPRTDPRPKLSIIRDIQEAVRTARTAGDELAACHLESQLKSPDVIRGLQPVTRLEA